MGRSAHVLLVEDSRAFAQMAAHAVESRLGIKVSTAATLAEAGRILDNLGGARVLVVTDFAMPNMDGVEMVRRIRQQRPKDELAIVALSGSDSFTNKGLLSARFLKNGANDFLTKPFEREEFHCRIEQNVSALETMERLRDLATKDFLTGLANRRHFFAEAEPLFAKNARLTAAMIDIDFFKRINDTHGHDCGDSVLKIVARTLAERVRSGDLLARFGGEEFCFLAKDLAKARTFFEDMRAAIAALAVPAIPVTASIGAAFGPAASLDALLKAADGALYRAKAGGRDRVEIAEAG